ncbi:hypothetical protein MYX77_09345 [Acidobacteriia bacterium AH_259_A11_L15]|nr:hypothetical protein [Acidobacteriia bacterium AH_259_A11_L15]
MSPSFILDPVLQQYSLQVQDLLEQHNNAGLTREEIGTLLEGPPPADPQALRGYQQRVDRHANKQFDKVRKVCRAMFEGGFEGWGFIWHRHAKPDIRWHVVAKVADGYRTPVLTVLPVGQIAQSELKEFQTRKRSVTRIELAHVKALENYARGLPPGRDRKTLLREIEERLNAVEIRNLRLAALNMDSGMSLEDFQQLTNPRDRRLRIFTKQTKLYVDLQKKANKELLELIEMYGAFKRIIGRDVKELGEGAGKLDKAKP